MQTTRPLSQRALQAPRRNEYRTANEARQTTLGKERVTAEEKSEAHERLIKIDFQIEEQEPENRTMYPEDRKLQAIEKQRVALTEAQSKLENQASEARQRIRQIEAQLPGAILAAAMENDKPALPMKLRREIQELNWQIENAVLGVELLKQKIRQLDNDEAKWKRRIQSREDYENRKKRLVEDPALAGDVGITDDLRERCNYLDGNTKDADAFIKKIRAKLKK